MCDYSLMNIPNRLAMEREVLVTHKFSSGSIGLASAEDVRKLQEPEHIVQRGLWRTLLDWIGSTPRRILCAVCIPPGGRLRVFGVPEQIQRALGVCSIEEVTFTQITASANQYRDALRFANGREVLLQEMGTGVGVQVLNLSLADAPVPASMERPIYR